jgi:hypothetical protein
MGEQPTCFTCGQELHRAPTGRPGRYCSVGCRRATEHEIRRLDRKLEQLDTQLTEVPPDGSPSLEMMGTHPFHYHGRTPKEHRAYLQEQLRQTADRLRECLDDPSREP